MKHVDNCMQTLRADPDKNVRSEQRELKPSHFCAWYLRGEEWENRDVQADAVI